VSFQPPRRALSLHAFTRRALESGVKLELKTRMLYFGGVTFINGESTPVESGDARRLRVRLRELADARRLQPAREDPAALFAQLYAWYRAGYLRLSGRRRMD
jgi:50S ribosomal protein L16 3-hydroxylase